MNFNKLLDQLSDIDLQSDKRIKKFLNKFINVGNKVKDKSIKELEIKKLEVELAKEKYNLGDYISDKYNHEKILDFSYDEDFQFRLKKIISLIDYMKKVKKT